MTDHAEMSRERLASAVAVRVYGVPLENTATLDGYTCILFCGIASNSEDQEKPCNRVWHIPKDAILRRGDIEGYSHEGKQVHWYELHRDSVPVEESYTPISLGLEIKRALPSPSLADETSVFAARVAERFHRPVDVPTVPTRPGGNQVARTVPGDVRDGLGCAALRAAGGYCQLTIYQEGSDTEMSL